MRAKKAVPPTSGSRVHGFLWCRMCQRSWAFQGTSDKASWPQHRCGRDVAPFQDFLLEDPNHTALPVWKQEAAKR